MATPTSQLLSRTLYDTDGITTVWDFSFSGGYLDPAHVRAYIESPLGTRTDIVVTEGMLIGAFQLRITPALAAGNELVIYRDTPKNLPLVDFTDEAGFSEVALDTNAKQAVFIAAEAIDTVNATDVTAAAAAAELAVSAQLAAEGSAVAALASQVAAAASAMAALTSENAAELAEANTAANLADALSIYGSVAAVNAAAAAASASATAADASKAQAGVSAANALASRNAAATSASAASASAGTASTQAGIATTQAGIATTRAAAALASANAANVSEAAADSSEAAAAASAASAAASLVDVVSIIANLTGRNKIINGKMEIAQRGLTHGALGLISRYTLDRWAWVAANTSAKVTASQATNVPSSEFQSSLRVMVSEASPALLAGEMASIEQRLEGLNVRDLIGRTFTLSFWVNSPQTGTHCVSFSNGGGNRSWVAEYTVNVAGSWEKKSITVPGGLITAGSWDWGVGAGLRVGFTLAAGTALQTTPGAWQVGAFRATAGQVNLLDAVSNNFFLTGVQLEAGMVASPFEHRQFGQELVLCQRYYQISGLHVYRAYSSGANDLLITSATFPVVMRAIPTMSYTQVFLENVSTVQPGSISSYGFSWRITSTALGMAQFQGTYTASAEL